MTVRLTTLGRPRAFLDERELATLPGRPVTFGLLVFLAVEREATRDRLTSVFWPESPQEKARHTLSQTLYEIKQSLGEGWAESSGNTLRVSDSVEVDCLEFIRLADSEEKDRALALYSGHFLEGVYLAQTHEYEEWVERTRARLNRKFRATVDGFLSELREGGDLDRALSMAWKWVGLDPLDDGGQQHLIRLLAETGSRTEALAQYDRYVVQLESELGLDPLEETVEMVEQIRSGTLQPPTPPPSPAEDGGHVAPGSEAGADETVWPSLPRGDGGEAPETPPPTDLHSFQRRLESELTPSLEILRPIGQGSMAHVYLAREPHLKRLVALKVLSPHLYSDARARKRFEREAQAAARINSPHVCTVHRVGSLSDGTPYLISHFVKGTSLAQRLKAQGRLPAPDVRRVLLEISSALAAAHKLGILHRDVRPDNVLRADETGSHSLCDFGLAGVLETGEEAGPKLTRTGEILGQPAYISPEQMAGLPLTDRADIFSLGVLGFQLLTGHAPPPADPSRRGASRGNSAVDLEPLTDFMKETDPGLAEIIGRCLAKDPAHRPSAADVERKLERRQGPPTGGQPSKDQASLGKMVFRKRLPQILAGYVAFAWIGIEAASLFQSRDAIDDWLFWLTAETALFGFFAVSVIGWFHGERGRQSMPAAEKWLLSVLAVGWIGVSLWVLLRP